MSKVTEFKSLVIAYGDARVNASSGSRETWPADSARMDKAFEAVIAALEAASSTPDGEAVKAWECPQCRCTSYARVEERKPGETKFTPGDSVRCVNCKFVSYLPVISHNAGEIEAGGEVAIDRVESASRLRQWARKHFGPWITHSTAKRAIDEILALKESRL